VPAEDVDRASLAEVIERHFHRRLPTIALEHPNDGVDELGVRRVEEAIEALAMPSDADVKIGAERGANGLDVGERRASKPASLEPRDLRRGDVGSCRQIHLPPAAPYPERPKRPTDTQCVHGAKRARLRLSVSHLGLSVSHLDRLGIESGEL
jgi:hypothetical protein